MTNHDSPQRPSTRPAADDDAPTEHGPGGMDNIDEDTVHGQDDDDAPGGMTGIPDSEST